ncbi:MAG: pilus assembly protein [Chloroflexi bacterium]|nr:pilus assembly protein [Chloroflexota bacterium]
MEKFVRLAKCARWGRRDQGQALVLFAGGLAVFCGLVGMSVDAGQLLYARTDLQKIADASALAGAQDLPASTADATTSATTYASANGSASTAISFGNANTTITVTATRRVNYTFLKVLGLSGADVTARATARASQLPITGYSWANVAPFTLWGGSRTSEVHPGDQSCPLHTCVGRSYTFMDTGWMAASGNPTAPDWTASSSNNFKGDVEHGAGAPVSQIGDFYSVGGFGNVSAPAVGSIIVIPIVDRASGNANSRTFRVAAWAIVRVDAGCTKQHCTGTLQSSSVTPPDGWVTDGSVPPPGGITYLGTTFGLTE